MDHTMPNGCERGSIGKGSRLHMSQVMNEMVDGRAMAFP
jgi:hypothetical protein